MPNQIKEFARSEFTEQVQVMKWLKLKYPDILVNSSPAGARYGRGKEAIIRGAMQKRAGASKGFPDIFIYQPVDHISIGANVCSSMSDSLNSLFKKVIKKDTVVRSPGDIRHTWFCGLAIEMKREKGGVVSDEQQAWIDGLNNAGYKAVVCRGYDEAIKTITEYLGEGVTNDRV